MPIDPDGATTAGDSIVATSVVTSGSPELPLVRVDDEVANRTAEAAASRLPVSSSSSGAQASTSKVETSSSASGCNR